MADDDRAARSHLEKLREEMEGKSPLEAVRDDMDELAPQFTDAVSDSDDDEGRALSGHRSSARTPPGSHQR